MKQVNIQVWWEIDQSIWDKINQFLSVNSRKHVYYSVYVSVWMKTNVKTWEQIHEELE